VAPLDHHNAALLNHVAPRDWLNPKPLEEYDLVAIGAGAGGLISAKQAARRGARSALIEKHLAGGDCLNVGCVPSKALIRSARAVKEVRNCAAFGVCVAGEVTVDFPAVMARMRRVRAEIAPADSYEGTAAAGAHMFAGKATFTGPNTLQVEESSGRVTEFRFKTAVIASGGRPIAPALYEHVPFVTNETLFNLTSLPPRMVVVGGGPIGLELAQCFAAFGCRVTVLVRGVRLLPKEDTDAAALLHAALLADGVEVLLSTAVKGAVQSGKTTATADGGSFLEVELTCTRADGSSFVLGCECLLLATGRAPNVLGLGLEAAGVEFNERTGVAVNDLLRTSNPSIYAVGDVCHRFQFTHMSGEMAKAAVENALFGGSWSLASLAVPWVTYTMPEVAHVGAYEHELDASGVEYDTYRAALEHNDRAILDGDTEGFVKLTCAKGTDRLLGGTIVAAHAGDLIHEVTLALKEGISIESLARVIHPYPTVGESVMGAALGYVRTVWK
ncbi:mercuric reductase, partial [Pavlovales sp. CCMP2436]